jgi:hypothetical protein
MSWVRRDDQASIHRKVAPLDDATYRLWSEAIEWCSRNLTDGVIRADELAEASKRGTQPRAARLVERVLWHTSDVLCQSPKCPPPGKDGWVIHDYFDYQPSREKVKAELVAKAKRTQEWRDRKAGKKPPSDVPGDASHDGYVSAANQDSVSSPSPPRPAPKGRGGTTSPQRQPAASGSVAAADGVANQNHHNSPMCPTCGNRPETAYHRNNCIVTNQLAGNGDP